MSIRLHPIANPDSPASGELERALRWFETRCRVQGVAEVSEDEVSAFLRDNFPEVADQFEPTHLRPARPSDPV